MVAYKKKLVVFGGFHDDMKKTPKYFNDVYVFDLETYTWSKLNFSLVLPQPEPRSGNRALFHLL